MNCYMCEYDGCCQLQLIASDITGCSGHSKYKENRKEVNNTKSEENHSTNIETLNLVDFKEKYKVGDIVIADNNPNNLRTYNLPGYLAGNALKVIGYTKTKVICDWDGGKPFKISPALLRKRRETNGF